jgi:chromate transporter
MGLLGALIALWATFAPCFLWIFVGAPYIEWINAQPRLKGALSGITAAVVGVILNLALWFALHLFFGTVERRTIGPLQLWTPHLETLDWRIVALAVISGILLLWEHWRIPWVLAVAGALAVLDQLLRAPG